MDFASSYILDNEEEVYECVSEDEFKEGMQLSESDSDSSDSADEQPAPRIKRSSGVFGAVQRVFSSRRKQKKVAKTKKQPHWKTYPAFSSNEKPTEECSTKKWFRKADTNVVSVNFGTLLSPGDRHAGDPVVCSSCQAILSHNSKVEGEMENKTWKCEFCNNEMHVDVEDEEIAKSEDVTYLMEPGIATKSASLSGHDQALVIFCVDTSGSMCVTTEVEGKVELRGTSHLQRLESCHAEGEDQYLPTQKRNVSYISRLQAMQAAVDDQLATMAKDFPDRRIGLITFSSDVSVVGDGQQDEVIVAGDKLKDMDQLVKEGSELALPQSIKDSRRVLGEKVYKFEEGGSTALGPALVVAVSMASHHPGSKVIVCTDGKANIGLGKLEDDVDEQSANEFYRGIGQKAVSKGVSISVITIKGTDCKLVHLGQLANKTGGQVNIVDPLNLTQEFGNILADPIIATNVKAKFLVHKALYVVNDNDRTSQECSGEYSPGNVKSSSAITFEFGKRQEKEKDSTYVNVPQPSSDSSNSTYVNVPDKKSKEAEVSEGESSGALAPIPESASAPPSDYPFQLQIHYTDTEGSKVLRVITKTMPATTDRNLAERNANMEILGVHAAKKSADLALQGQYSESRGVALMNQRFAWRKSHSEVSSKGERRRYKNIYSKLRNMENLIQRRQQAEIAEFGCTRSDSEGEDDMDIDVCYSANPVMADSSGSRSLQVPEMSRIKRLHVKRSSEMDDDLAHMAYKMHAVNQDEMAAPEDYGKKAKSKSSGN